MAFSVVVDCCSVDIICQHFQQFEFCFDRHNVLQAVCHFDTGSYQSLGQFCFLIFLYINFLSLSFPVEGVGHRRDLL